MLTNPPTRSLMDDPRRLRDMLDRAHELVSTHDVSSVVVGLAGFEGDRDFPDLVDYVVSALRIDDSVLRLTNERAVVLLADTDVGKAGEVGVVGGAGRVRRALDRDEGRDNQSENNQKERK